MDFITALLRLVHIFAGIIWIGFGIFQVMYLIPALNQSGSQGYKVYAAMNNLPGFVMMMPAVSGLTTLAGLALYGMLGWHNLLGTLGGVLLSVGALFGLLAMGHGIGLGAVSKRFGAALEAWSKNGNPDSGETFANVEALANKLRSNGRISVILTVIAVIGMVMARPLMSVIL